jgi:hypothetical protein
MFAAPLIVAPKTQMQDYNMNNKNEYYFVTLKTAG